MVLNILNCSLNLLLNLKIHENVLILHVLYTKILCHIVLLQNLPTISLIVLSLYQNTFEHG